MTYLISNLPTKLHIEGHVWRYKGVIRSRKSKNRQYYGLKKGTEKLTLNTTQKIKY